MSVPNNSQQLGHKEANLFKDVIKLYDNKNYKRGLKTCEQILKKYPEHGETLAMKGLFKKLTGSKTESYELVKSGIKFNLKSPICWHVYGILYRDDELYTDAIKCYNSALRYDPNNGNILRDLAALQIQIRDFRGYLETRRIILSKQANNPLSWYTFAMASHLNDLRYQSIDVLNTIRSQPKHKQSQHTCNDEECTLNEIGHASYEDSEVILYNALILEELKEYDDSIYLLESKLQHIMDHSRREEMLGRLHLKLSQYEQSFKYYEHLLSNNPYNYQYHYGLQQSILKLQEYEINSINLSILSNDQKSILLEYYSPKKDICDTYHLFYITLLDGDEIKIELGKYINLKLKKGVTSLYNDLKYFVNTPKYSEIITTISKEIVDDIESNKSGDYQIQYIVCGYILLSMIMCNKNNFDEAIKYIDIALSKETNNVDLYLKKAYIFKHQGKLIEAANLLDEGRRKDLGDRYVNTKASKYYLRCNDIKKSGEIISLFTRSKIDYKRDIPYMQVIWYEYELANAYYRLDNIPMALKWYNNILKNFSEFIDDLFDFHFYAFRKYNFSAYYKILSYLDNIYQDKYYLRAVKGCVTCYLYLIDHPVKARLHHQKPQNTTNNKKKDDFPFIPVDEDTDGTILASQNNIPEIVFTLLSPISLVKCDDHILQLMLYQSSVSKCKYLMAMTALQKAMTIAPDYPEVHDKISEWKSNCQRYKTHKYLVILIDEFNLKINDFLSKSHPKFHR